MNDKQEESKKMIEEINLIRADIQNVFFKIKKFQEFDSANQCQKYIISSLDEISKIQKNIISKDILLKKEVNEG